MRLVPVSPRPVGGGLPRSWNSREGQAPPVPQPLSCPVPPRVSLQSSRSAPSQGLGQGSRASSVPLVCELALGCWGKRFAFQQMPRCLVSSLETRRRIFCRSRASLLTRAHRQPMAGPEGQVLLSMEKGECRYFSSVIFTKEWGTGVNVNT